MPDPIQRRNPHRAVGETNQDAINRLAGERAAALADADRLRSEVAELHTWAGLMSLLDEHCPADVVDGSSGDPGPRIVALLREVAALRAAGNALAQAARRYAGFGGSAHCGKLLDQVTAWRSAAGAVLSADEADFAGPPDPEQYRRGHLDGRALVTGLLPDVARYALDVETRRRDAARRELAYLDGRVAGCRVGRAAQSTPTTGEGPTT